VFLPIDDDVAESVVVDNRHDITPLEERSLKVNYPEGRISIRAPQSSSSFGRFPLFGRGNGRRREGGGKEERVYELALMLAQKAEEVEVDLTLPGIIAVIAGVLILFIPRLLNYIVAGYLIFVGIVEIFDIRI
jgi:hypothetical protein